MDGMNRDKGSYQLSHIYDNLFAPKLSGERRLQLYELNCGAINCITYLLKKERKVWRVLVCRLRMLSMMTGDWELRLCCMARRRCHLTDCNAVKICWPVSWHRAAAGPVPSLCYSRYTGCQSASASDTKLPVKAHRLSSPPYLNSLLNDYVSSRTLRLSSMPRLIVPRTRTELAKWAFSVAAPALWNSLPLDVVDTNTLTTFKKHLKTYLYQCTYLT